MTDREDAAAAELRLLGPIEFWHGGSRKSLPRSKKTRALLAYLAMASQPLSRNRLCELFWDVTDDPRGALRWSLSRLRKVVDGDVRRIEADRTRVAFAPAGARVDARELMAVVRQGVDQVATDELEAAAQLARGEFLEGLELPDFYEFQAWCVAQREQAREARCAVLAELVRRLKGEPRRALPHARAHVQADALSVAARGELLELLVRAGKADEAEKQLEMSCRLLREVGAPGERELEGIWRQLSAAEPGPDPAPAPATTPPSRPSPPPPPPTAPTAARQPFVGRTAERDRLLALLDESRTRGSQRIALVTGEAGAGKSRLAELLIERARQAGSAILDSRAYEAESSRPYGPWVDALRTELPNLLANPADDRTLPTRDALFGAVADAVATRAAEHGGALLLLDDIQWLDSDSAELLHFVTRTSRQRPIFIALLARTGELSDNEHALRALRSLRREVRIEELALEPLTAAEVAELVASYPGADAAGIYDACAGNPLFALELARAADSAVDEQPPSLLELVRGRIARLPAHAAELLRWTAVVGHGVELAQLQALSSLELEELVDALERLEQHTLLQSADGGVRYTFAHDVVREAVYGELSHPRRRLMHQKVARMLAADRGNRAVATELAHHASLAGDAMLGVRACIDAGLQSLRVFANGDAEALAKRGLRLVDDLAGDARTEATLELLHVQYTARTPDPEQAAARIRTLTDQAVDAGLTSAARLGFQMLSYLRWERGSMLAAHDNIMRAERISRSAEPAERTVALSQAAKCLVLLERDLPLAESFLLEATALAGRVGRSPSSMRFAVGMMHEHRGELDDAFAAFRDARQLGRQQGDPLAEFCAIEHLMMLELDRGNCRRALDLATDLSELGGRVRDGAEAACGRALHALARRYCGEAGTDAVLEETMSALRAADSKYRLAFVLSRLARWELRHGTVDTARQRAGDALALATDINRASEMVLAHTLLARCADRDGDGDALAAHLEALESLRDQELSAAAREQLDQTMSKLSA